MAGELPRPGVEIIQTFATASPSFNTPALVPCAIGPAFEVINILNTDGTLNSKAKYGAYAQFGSAITESSFPDPRNNIDELNILEETIRPFMLAGGTLSELPMNPGSAFMASSHGAGKAALTSAVFATTLAIQGKVLVIAIDQPARLSTAMDVVVTFVGSSALTAAETATQINDAVGTEVAFVTSSNAVRIVSPTYGALSSVTVRAGGSANDLLRLGYKAADVGNETAHEERMEGSGYRGQDQSNNTTKTPWIEFYIGAYQIDGATTTPNAKAGLINVETQTFVSALHSAVTFGSSGTYDLRPGDFFYSDGLRPSSSEVAKVETARFKLGTINTTQSVADSSGKYITKVYDVLQVGTIYDADALAPTYAYLKANDIEWKKVAPIAAPSMGSVASTAAVKGSVTGTALGTSIAVAGLTLHYISTIAGTDTEGTITLTGGPYADDTLPTGTGDAISGTAPAMTLTDAGATFLPAYVGQTITIVGAALPANNGTFPIASYTGPTAIVYTNGAGVAAPAFAGTWTINISIVTAVDKLAAVLNTLVPGTTCVNTTPGVSLGALKFTCVTASRLDIITIKKDGTSNATLGFSTTTDVVSTNQADATFTGLSGKSLSFTMDSNPHLYTVGFSDNSIDLAIDEINHVVGAVVASKEGATVTPKLILTSTLKGAASRVSVPAVTPTQAETVFGLSATAVVGTGRPLPDAYLDDASILNIQSDIIRDLVTGYPLDQTFNTATLYIQFKALRLDVTAVAQVAGVIRLADVATLGAVLDPLTEDNPLGLAGFLMMINAPTYEIKLLGVDEVTPAAMTGTSAAYARAASLLEAEEVYALAPLSQDEVVGGLWRTHCQVMSEPEQGGERIVFFNKPMPTRKNPTIVLSGTQANSTSTANQLLLDGNPAPGLIAAGINPGLPIPETAEVYTEFEVEGEVRRYSVSSVSGALANFRITFSDPNTNLDGWYSTVAFDVGLVNASYAMKVRGASLAIPGSNPVRMDYSLMAETVAEANSGYHNRRAYSVFPDTIKTVIAGIEKALPGYYACAAICGMVGAQPPQQGFTNFPITGITGVVGTEKFTKRQLNVIAGGGTYTLIQDAIGGPVSSRHQLSTDLTSIETRELSITKVVDFTAKILRLAVRKFIGINNVNASLLDSLGTTVNAVLKFLEESAVLNGSNLNNIAQDKDNRDTVILDVTLDVPYPCNYLRVTLVV